MFSMYNFFINDIFFLPAIIYINVYIYIYTFLKNYFKKLLNIKNNNNKNIKNILKINNHNYYIFLLKYFYNYIIMLIIIIYSNANYSNGYINNCIYNSFYLNNLNLLYYRIILILSLISFIIFKKNINNQKNFEIILGYLLFFFSLLYYLLVNNLVTLIFIFEFQSLIYMYLISNLFFLKNNTYLNFRYLNKQPLWYFNSLLYQFWVSFFGAILLIYTLLIFLKKIHFVDWINVEIYLYMLNISFFYQKKLEILMIFLPLIAGLFLKLGLLPFFFWKPEIYKNFNIDILFLYMTTYIFSVLFFIIFFISQYFLLINQFFFYYIYIIIIFSLILLPIIFYSIVEIRVFLAYTSIFHIIIILISIFYNNYFNNSSFIYLFTYFFFSFYFLVLLYYLTNFNLWYMNEFQYFYKNQLVNLVLMNLFLGMAGIPPFFGFFSKILIISSLLYYNNYFLFTLFFISSLVISFFYIQNYRFYGYNIKNITYLKNNLIIIYNNKFINLLLIFIFFNLFSIFFINEIYIYSFIFKLN